jgi:predicted nucleic acid-binding protein
LPRWRHGSGFEITYWDAAILEVARALGCELVLTEALSDGQDGVKVENPFPGLLSVSAT